MFGDEKNNVTKIGKKKHWLSFSFEMPKLSLHVEITKHN